MKRAVQHFSDTYLLETKRLSPSQIVRFIEDFQRLHGAQEDESQNTLISLRISQRLLNAFRLRARLEGVKYQTKIKSLMETWVKEE